MKEVTFRAKLRPTLTADAASLVEAYESTYGSTSTGCCPEALAAVLDRITSMDLGLRDLRRLATELRGAGE